MEDRKGKEMKGKQGSRQMGGARQRNRFRRVLAAPRFEEGGVMGLLLFSREGERKRHDTA